MKARTILIVDDESSIRLLLKQTLEDFEDHNVNILTADNGIEALEMTQMHLPALIILDVMMPLMDGFEVCDQIKNQLGIDTYIVLLTAKGQESDFKIGIEKGADRYITKPFDPDEIILIAENALGIKV